MIFLFLRIRSREACKATKKLPVVTGRDEPGSCSPEKKTDGRVIGGRHSWTIFPWREGMAIYDGRCTFLAGNAGDSRRGVIS